MSFSPSLRDALIDAGFNQQINEALQEFLLGAGYSSALPDSLYYYLDGLGYTGSLSDKIKAWEADGYIVSVIGVTTAPYLDKQLLLVGNTLSGAFVSGTYPDFQGNPVSEASPTYEVDGVAQAGSYVLLAGDVSATATVVLSATGAEDRTYTTAAQPITDFSWADTDLEWTVTAGSGASVPDAFVIGNWALNDPGTDGDLTIVISTLPADNGFALTDIEYRVNGGTATSVASATTGSYNISGLTNGISANVEIRALNSQGSGAWSDVKAQTPSTIPDAFVIGNWTLTDLASTGDARIAISALPADNGSALTDIEYRKDGGTATSLGAATTGNYDLAIFTDGVSADIEIRAVNANGSSAWSDVKAVTTTAASSGWTLVGISPVIKGIVASSQQTDLTALTGGIDTAAAAGDLVVTIAGAASNTDRNLAISGQDSIIQDRVTNDTYRAMLVIGQKVMTGTPDTSVTITANASSGSSLAAVSYVFRDMNATNEDTLNTNTLNTFDPVMSAVTPTTSGAVALVAAVSAHNRGAINFNLGGDVYSTAFDSRNGTQDITFGVGLIDYSGGTITPAAWTITGTDSAQFSNISASVAYAPA